MDISLVQVKLISTSNLNICVCFICRESVAQMMQAGQRVIDNPVYLSDLGKGN